VIACLTRAPIHVGDVIYSVNGVQECAVARTATDYIQLQHGPGELVELGIVRNGEWTTCRVRLYRVPSAIRKAWRAVSSIIHPR
jgi:hypothetical protein